MQARTMRTIALLTDFGLDDHFCGVVKGAILKVNGPRTRPSIIGRLRPIIRTFGNKKFCVDLWIPEPCIQKFC